MSTMLNHCLEVLAKADEQGVLLRVIGGLAIRIHSPRASQLPSLAREYADLDFVTTSDYSSKLRPLFESLNFTPHTRFNSMQGRTRMIFYSPGDQWHVDIFIDKFELCHKIDFRRQDLEREKQTIPLSEVFLTKMQIIQLNQKDVKDIAALLLEHRVDAEDEEAVNSARIIQVLGRDWGFYTTVTKNIARVPQFLQQLSLTDEQVQCVSGRLGELQKAIESAPKSMGWKMRARVGERVKWYQEPEEPTTQTIQLYPNNPD